MLWATDWWGRSFRTVNETRTEQLLAAAAHFGHIDLVKTPLREGIDPSKQSKLFDFPIKVAAEYERNDIVELRLSSISDENQLLSRRGSAIKGASKGGHIDTLDLILESRWGPGTKHRRILKTLIWSLRVVRRIEIFIHIEKLINSSGILIPSINFKHLLILAARNGDLEIACHILSRPRFRFGLLLKQKCLKVALREAARRGHSEIVELLFRRTRYFMTRDEKLLSFAAKGGHLRIVEKLITLGFDVNPDKVHLNVDLTPPIFCAIALEHEPMFHLLRNKGAVLNTIHTGGDALICCYTEGLESMMALLLREGVDINSEPLSRIPDFNEQEFQEMLAEVKNSVEKENKIQVHKRRKDDTVEPRSANRRHQRHISKFSCFG